MAKKINDDDLIEIAGGLEDPVIHVKPEDPSPAGGRPSREGGETGTGGVGNLDPNAEGGNDGNQSL